MKKLENHVVIGMAGHIDHGKTSLIKALTGTNTDRLKEEKERGMTTDLGFAFMGDDITIIDVPGHEKFVKTMVAGVTTVDMALFVIAADDGVMPQSVEHLEILNILGVKRAIVVLNKIDMVEEEWAELVQDDIRELLKGTSIENAPIVPVSAVKEIGIDDLKEKIFELAKEVPPRPDNGLFRMFVDRVFTIKGFGTVVAGTVLSGVIHPEDSAEIQPKDFQTRIRGIQVHGKKVQETEVGIRAAINITADKSDVERGDVLVEPGFSRPTSMIDARFMLLNTAPRPLKNRDRVRVHIGTAEVMARVGMIGREKMEPGDTGFVQLRFEKPVVGERNDRFVIRSYSPVQTIGGGTFVDPHPIKHKMSDQGALKQVEQLYEGDPNQFILDYFERFRFMPQNVDEISKSLATTKDEAETRLTCLIDSGRVRKIGKKRFVAVKNYEALSAKSILLLKKYLEQNRLRRTMSSALLKSQIKLPVDPNMFKVMLEELVEQNEIAVAGDNISLVGYDVQLSPEESTVRDSLLKKYCSSGLVTPLPADALAGEGKNAQGILEYLIDSRELIRVEENIVFSHSELKKALITIADSYESEQDVSISQFREIFGNVSRKYVVGILAYSDRIGLTERIGDTRILRDRTVAETF